MRLLLLILIGFTSNQLYSMEGTSMAFKKTPLKYFISKRQVVRESTFLGNGHRKDYKYQEKIYNS